MNAARDSAHAELLAREKRGAAIHEASHAVLVRAFGGLAAPRIYETGAMSPDCKAWGGTCVLMAKPGLARFPRGHKTRLGILRTPKRWAVYVGLAGYVGEQLAIGTAEPWEVAEAYALALEWGEISETDLELMEWAEVSYRHIAQTVRYLQGLWPEVEREAAHLMATA